MYVEKLEICNFGNECRKREDRDYEDVITTATEDFMTKITNKTMKPTWSEMHCQTFNVDFGENKLFNLFKSSYFTPEEEKHVGLFQSTRPDILHNFNLGIVRDVIGYIMAIIDCIGKSDQHFANSRIIVDYRISTFQHRQTLELFRSVHFSQGVSQYFHNSLNSDKGKGTGFSTGFMEGWKSIPLLVQLLFSLGHKKSVLPNDNFWFRTHINNDYYDNNEIVNPDSIVKKAAVNVLELYLFLQSKSMTSNNLEKLKNLIISVQVSIQRLFRLRQQLLFTVIKTLQDKKVDSHSLPEYNGIKLHMLSHLVENIQMYGTYNPAYFGELSEKKHKTVAKQYWNVTSKRENTITSELIQLNLQGILTEDRDRINSMEIQKETQPHEKVNYTFDYNSSTIELKIDEEDKTWSAITENKDPTLAIIPLLEFKNIPDIIRNIMSRQENNFSEDERKIINEAFEGHNNYRIFLLHSVKNNGLPTKRISPFTIHATRQYNSRNSTINDEKCSKSEFSFVETIYKDDHGKDITWLARTAFLLCIEKYDEDKNFIQNVMMGGFFFFQEISTKKKVTMPYKEMFYRRLNNSCRLPELDLLSLELISAPAFVVPDRTESINDKIVYESTFTINDKRWKLQSYIWIDFAWTRHDDDIDMMEMDTDQEEFFHIRQEDIEVVNEQMQNLHNDNDDNREVVRDMDEEESDDDR